MSIKIPLNTTFCSAVFWWLIWLQKPHYPASVETERSSNEQVLTPNLPVVEKECSTWFLLNSFISMTLSEFSFAVLNEKSMWRNISPSNKKINKKSEKFIFSVKQESRWWFHVCLFLVFQQTCWTLLVQTTEWFELHARWMSWSVHLNDRKAAYHVPHRQATDICHLHSFSFPLPASPASCLPNKHLYALAHIHTLLC